MFFSNHKSSGGGGGHRHFVSILDLQLFVCCSSLSSFQLCLITPLSNVKSTFTENLSRQAEVRWNQFHSEPTNKDDAGKIRLNLWWWNKLRLRAVKRWVIRSCWPPDAHVNYLICLEECSVNEICMLERQQQLFLKWSWMTCGLMWGDVMWETLVL